jgi:hypothetical protein
MPLSPHLEIPKLALWSSRLLVLSQNTFDVLISAPPNSGMKLVGRAHGRLAGLIVAKELKRLQSHLVCLDRFIWSHVSRLLKSNLVTVLVKL